MIKNALKNGAISFVIGSLSGLIVNLIIDAVANALGAEDYCSISPSFQALFPTSVMAAYVNVLLYGCISASFAIMTFIYDVERIGFVIQSIIYFLTTSVACLVITMLLWQLQRYPLGLFLTLTCYALTHVIMISMAYKKLRKDVSEINQELLPVDAE